MQFCSAHRTPHGGERIEDAEAALAVLALALRTTPTDETVAILLDHDRCGHCITVVDGTHRPDDVIEVVEVLSYAGAENGRLGALIVASSRPGGGLLPDDGDRWLEMSDVAGSFGVELVEWFVVGETVDCPRDLLGEPPRW